MGLLDALAPREDGEQHAPCRFCGSTYPSDLSAVEYDWWPVAGWHVSCEGCGALGPQAYSREEAWELWDRALGDGGGAR